MESIAVAKPNMRVTGQDPLSPFGLLSTLFFEEIARRRSQPLSFYRPISLIYLEDMEERRMPAPPELHMKFNVELLLNRLFKQTREKTKGETKPKTPPERILERVVLREKELRTTRTEARRVVIENAGGRMTMQLPGRAEASRDGIMRNETGGELSTSELWQAGVGLGQSVPRVQRRAVDRPQSGFALRTTGVIFSGKPAGSFSDRTMTLASQAMSVPSAGGWTPKQQELHPGYPAHTDKKIGSGTASGSILLPDVLRRRREEAIERRETLGAFVGEPESFAALEDALAWTVEGAAQTADSERVLQQVRCAVEKTLRHNAERVALSAGGTGYSADNGAASQKSQPLGSRRESGEFLAGAHGRGQAPDGGRQSMVSGSPLSQTAALLRGASDSPSATALSRARKTAADTAESSAAGQESDGAAVGFPAKQDPIIQDKTEDSALQKAAYDDIFRQDGTVGHEKPFLLSQETGTATPAAPPAEAAAVRAEAQELYYREEPRDGISTSPEKKTSTVPTGKEPVPEPVKGPPGTLPVSPATARWLPRKWNEASTETEVLPKTESDSDACRETARQPVVPTAPVDRQKRATDAGQAPERPAATPQAGLSSIQTETSEMVSTIPTVADETIPAVPADTGTEKPESMELALLERPTDGEPGVWEEKAGAAPTRAQTTSADTAEGERKKLSASFMDVASQMREMGKALSVKAGLQPAENQISAFPAKAAEQFASAKLTYRGEADESLVQSCVLHAGTTNQQTGVWQTCDAAAQQEAKPGSARSAAVDHAARRSVSLTDHPVFSETKASEQHKEMRLSASGTSLSASQEPSERLSGDATVPPEGDIPSGLPVFSAEQSVLPTELVYREAPEQGRTRTLEPAASSRGRIAAPATFPGKSAEKLTAVAPAAPGEKVSPLHREADIANDAAGPDSVPLLRAPAAIPAESATEQPAAAMLAYRKEQGETVLRITRQDAGAVFSGAAEQISESIGHTPRDIRVAGTPNDEKPKVFEKRAVPRTAGTKQTAATALKTAGTVRAAMQTVEPYDYSEVPELVFAAAAQGPASFPEQAASEPARKPPQANQAEQLPHWAKELLEKAGVADTSQMAATFQRDPAGGAKGQQVNWTAPGTYDPQQSRLSRPAELTFREREEAEQMPYRQPFSDAELRRTADRVYRIIEERLRRELRRSGR